MNLERMKGVRERLPYSQGNPSLVTYKITSNREDVKATRAAYSCAQFQSANFFFHIRDVPDMTKGVGGRVWAFVLRLQNDIES